MTPPSATTGLHKNCNLFISWPIGLILLTCILPYVLMKLWKLEPDCSSPLGGVAFWTSSDPPPSIPKASFAWIPPIKCTASVVLLYNLHANGLLNELETGFWRLGGYSLRKHGQNRGPYNRTLLYVHARIGYFVFITWGDKPAGLSLGRALLITACSFAIAITWSGYCKFCNDLIKLFLPFSW